jgi:5-methylcytosine-specific restriction endonuclease McrA
MTIKRKRLPDSLCKLVAARQQYRCQACDQLLDHCFEVDHVDEIADGGDQLDDQNLQALCPGCHRKKTHAWRLEHVKRRAAAVADAKTYQTTRQILEEETERLETNPFLRFAFVPKTLRQRRNLETRG